MLSLAALNGLVHCIDANVPISSYEPRETPLLLYVLAGHTSISNIKCTNYGSNLWRNFSKQTILSCWQYLILLGILVEDEEGNPNYDIYELFMGYGAFPNSVFNSRHFIRKLIKEHSDCNRTPLLCTADETLDGRFLYWDFPTIFPSHEFLITKQFRMQD